MRIPAFFFERLRRPSGCRQGRPRHACERGFTLTEVLIVVSIVGVMASAATVSFASARSRSRDLQRQADVRQFQLALETYREAHGGYPSDGVAGQDGVAIGSSMARFLSDGGFGAASSGTTYMAGAPANPAPHGVQYVYRGLNADGSDCDKDVCEAYAILFALERGDDETPAGAHAMTPRGVTAPVGFSEELLRQAAVSGVGAAGGMAAAETYVKVAADTVTAFVSDPTVQTVSEVAVAPAAAVAAAANTTLATAHFGQYLLLFLTQPAALFGRRRRKSWGTVFNAATLVPVDLAIIRLRDAANGRVVRSTVTDAEGRYSFLVPKGRYRLEVAKAGLSFPSRTLMSQTAAGPYHDLYHGTAIDIGADGAVLAMDIPADPNVADATDTEVIKRQSSRALHRDIALLGPVLGGVVFAVRPSVFVGLLLFAQVVMYLLFRRLAQPVEPKNWGVIYHQVTGEPVSQAVVRIFSAKYSKLLEAQVTDAQGRYHFRVMANVFYLTASKKDFRTTETDPIDLTDAKGPVVIASDLPLSPVNGGVIVAPTAKERVAAAKKLAAANRAARRAAGQGESVVPDVPDALRTDGILSAAAKVASPSPAPVAPPAPPQGTLADILPPASENGGLPPTGEQPPKDKAPDAPGVWFRDS